MYRGKENQVWRGPKLEMCKGPYSIQYIDKSIVYFNVEEEYFLTKHRFLDYKIHCSVNYRTFGGPL